MSDLLLIGATGLVGAKVAAALPAASLTIVARRAVDVAKGVSVHVAPPEQWPDLIASARPDAFINCLGTTIKQAGSQAAFRAIDHDLVLAAARAARASGARHCISVSSVGASARAGNFYLRTKGDVEAGLGALGFERLDILRPGLLTGDRGGPARPGEALAMLAAPLTDMLLHGGLRRYRSISADLVARAIAALASADGAGVHIHEHDAIIALAD
jgi:uncharacterized protein YbjT (DUF2867 family)